MSSESSYEEGSLNVKMTENQASVRQQPCSAKKCRQNCEGHWRELSVGAAENGASLQQVHLRTVGPWLRGVAVTAGAHGLLGMFIQWHKELKGFKNYLSRCVDDREAVNAEGP